MRLHKKLNGGLNNMSQENLAVILGALFAISEGLAMIPGIKSNSIFQLIYSGLKKLTGK